MSILSLLNFCVPINLVAMPSFLKSGCTISGLMSMCLGVDLEIEKRYYRLKSQPRSCQIQIFLDELYDRYKRPLLKIVYKHIGDPNISEDLFQDIFIRIIKQAELLYTLPKPKLEAYIFLIAKGVSYDYLRKKYKNVEVDITDDVIESLGVEGKQLTPSGMDAFQKADLAMMLDSLPSEDKLLLIGKYYLGLSIDDLTSVVGGTRSSIKSKLHRARKRAFEEWTKSGISMEDFFDE